MGAFELASGLADGALFAGLTPEGEWLEIAGEHFHQLAVDAPVRLARPPAAQPETVALYRQLAS